MEREKMYVGCCEKFCKLALKICHFQDEKLFCEEFWFVYMKKVNFHVEKHYIYAEKMLTGGKNFPYVCNQNFLFQFEKHIYAEKMLTEDKKFPCVCVKHFLFYLWKTAAFFAVPYKIFGSSV